MSARQTLITTQHAATTGDRASPLRHIDRAAPRSGARRIAGRNLPPPGPTVVVAAIFAGVFASTTNAQILTPLQRNGQVDLAVGIGTGGGGGEYAPAIQTFDDWHPHGQFAFTAAGYLSNPACQGQNASGSVTMDTVRTAQSLSIFFSGDRFRVPGPCGVSASSMASDSWVFSLDRPARFTLVVRVAMATNSQFGATHVAFSGQQYGAVPAGTMHLTTGTLNGSIINPPTSGDLSQTFMYAGSLSAGGYGAAINQQVSSADGPASYSSTYTLRVFCPTDFDYSGTLAIADIFAFLSAWFAGTSTADFNAINGINVQDIFDFLAAWFAGC